MADIDNHIFDTIDRQEREKGASALSRRRLIGTTAAAMGSMGLLGLASTDAEAKVSTGDANDMQKIANVAATAEVLATILNTVGPEKLGNKLDAVTKRNVMTAAQQEKEHYELLVSSAVGGTPVTKTIYIPDKYLASPEGLLTALAVGDQIFINAYLLATTVFARMGTLTGSKFARYTAEIMGVESVHRALAIQSLGRLGNDRVFARFGQEEEAKGLPTTGKAGFFRIEDAALYLEQAGFGFGKEGRLPGHPYEYDEVSKRTPTDPDVNTMAIR